jgi:RHS repeat-associated protein
VTLDYGESGNVTQMIVHSQCVDVSNARRCADPRASSFTARRTALETNCRCAEEQRYVYDWDELNRVAEARRYERHGTGGWPLAVQQRYFYDAGNVRMVKETVDFGRVNEGASFNATTLYPYPGDYERRGVTLDFAGSTYNASPTLGTETQYMVGGARLVWASNTPGSGNLTREQRLTLPLSDLVQSTAAVVDLQSGELLEHTTFYPNGARETHRTTDEVSLQLEPIGFTGKEADEEVGLVYFGERYLIPRLGRWASVDPLSVHAVGGGEALNGYHYVGGNLLQARDPLGLDIEDMPDELFYGVFAHRLIGQAYRSLNMAANGVYVNHYKIRHLLTTHTSLGDPAQMAALDAADAAGTVSTLRLDRKPDIFDSRADIRAMAEIKPDNDAGLEAARREHARDLDTVNSSLRAGQASFQGLTDFDGELQFDGDMNGLQFRVSWRNPEPGVVLYRWDVRRSDQRSDDQAWRPATDAEMSDARGQMNDIFMYRLMRDILLEGLESVEGLADLVGKVAYYQQRSSIVQRLFDAVWGPASRPTHGEENRPSESGSEEIGIDSLPSSPTENDNAVPIKLPNAA